MHNKLSIPDAIKKLFNIEVSKESPFLKNKANSFVRNKLIKTVTENNVQRKNIYLEDDQQLIVLFNALLLNAFYPDPKHVKKIFEDKKYRAECTESIKALFGNQNHLSGQALCSVKVIELINTLDSDKDLYTTQIPNPFTVLPQLALGPNTGLLNNLLLQASSLNPVDSVLISITKNDWLTAKKQTAYLSDDMPGSSEIVKMINNHIDEAKEFDELLDFFYKL
ncbi:hypothetical protein [Photobacterium leiognathi]|uniref:hypothetical protein n=1 Tax=Photobacterium leiognathi TaxID=553611 RepID=UPI00298272CC|nr:hypothetical protein [Photobacterium leiognathi]